MVATAARSRDVEARQPKARCKVLIVGRSSIFRNGIHALTELQPEVSECRTVLTCTEGIEVAKTFEPHVVLVDVTTPCGSTSQIAGDFRLCREEMSIMLYSDGDYIPETLTRDAEAHGSFTRTTSPASIKRFVSKVVREQDVAVSAEEDEVRTVRLSGRQLEVLREVARGSSNPEIARTLLMSSHTVKQHTQAIYQRLGVRNRIEAVTLAQRLGLVAVDV